MQLETITGRSGLPPPGRVSRVRPGPSLTGPTPMEHASSMNCAGCGREVEAGGSMKIGFRDCCDHCGADLHSCHNCQHHDSAAYNECAEPGAERVSERDRANRCDWFSPGEQAGGDSHASKGPALGNLEALFKK